MMSVPPEVPLNRKTSPKPNPESDPARIADKKRSCSRLNCDIMGTKRQNHKKKDKQRVPQIV